MLGGEECHHVLVISAIAYMVVNKDIGIEQVKDLGECPGVSGITFNKVAV
jgi:hypothetical protein